MIISVAFANTTEAARRARKRKRKKKLQFARALPLHPASCPKARPKLSESEKIPHRANIQTALGSS